MMNINDENSYHLIILDLFSAINLIDYIFNLEPNKIENENKKNNNNKQ